MQAWVTSSGGRTTVCDPHGLGGDQCGEQLGPDLDTFFVKKTSRSIPAFLTLLKEAALNLIRRNQGLLCWCLSLSAALL